MIRSRLLLDVPGFAHAHSERRDGSITSVRSGARGLLVEAVGGVPGSEVTGEQVHGSRVGRVGPEHAGSVIPGTDGLVTADPGVPLLVKGADCPLGVLVDPQARVVGVFHSGWRGAVARIAAAVVEQACRLGADPARLRVAVFPGIGPCCFDVGAEVRDRFATEFDPVADTWFSTASTTSTVSRLDLHAAVRHTLLGAGILQEHIDVIADCTACGDRFWSYRASGGGSGRHGLCAGLACGE